MKHKNLRFSLKTVTEQQVTRAMDDMKKKKSAGMDGIPQKSLLMGTEVVDRLKTMTYSIITINAMFISL